MRVCGEGDGRGWEQGVSPKPGKSQVAIVFHRNTGTGPYAVKYANC